MERIKFDKYRLKLYGKEPVCVLIPHKISRMWRLVGFREEEYGTDIQGDMDAMLALMYSFAVLMNDPYKIIFFPIRNNSKCQGCGYEPIREDIVFTTRKVTFKVKDWKNYKKLIGKNRPETYILSYDRNRMDAYVENFLARRRYHDDDRWNRFNGYERVCFDTLFMCVDQVAYLEAYKNMREWLDEDLDDCFLHQDWLPYGGYLHVLSPYPRDPRLNHSSRFYLEMYYVNEKLAEEKKGMAGQIT